MNRDDLLNDFAEWLRENGVKNQFVAKYLDALEYMNRLVQKVTDDTVSLYSITDPNEVAVAGKRIKNNVAFGIRKITCGGRIYQQTLDSFSKYIIARNDRLIPTLPITADRANNQKLDVVTAEKILIDTLEELEVNENQHKALDAVEDLRIDCTDEEEIVGEVAPEMVCKIISGKTDKLDCPDCIVGTQGEPVNQSSGAEVDAKYYLFWANIFPDYKFKEFVSALVRNKINELEGLKGISLIEFLNENNILGGERRYALVQAIMEIIDELLISTKEDNSKLGFEVIPTAYTDNTPVIELEQQEQQTGFTSIQNGLSADSKAQNGVEPSESKSAADGEKRVSYTEGDRVKHRYLGWGTVTGIIDNDIMVKYDVGFLHRAIQIDSIAEVIVDRKLLADSDDTPQKILEQVEPQSEPLPVLPVDSVGKKAPVLSSGDEVSYGKSAKQNKGEVKFTEGARVRHRDIGWGTITDLTSTYVKVRFDSNHCVQKSFFRNEVDQWLVEILPSVEAVDTSENLLKQTSTQSIPIPVQPIGRDEGPARVLLNATENPKRISEKISVSSGNFTLEERVKHRALGWGTVAGVTSKFLRVSFDSRPSYLWAVALSNIDQWLVERLPAVEPTKPVEIPPIVTDIKRETKILPVPSPAPINSIDEEIAPKSLSGAEWCDFINEGNRRTYYTKGDRVKHCDLGWGTIFQIFPKSFRVRFDSSQLCRREFTHGNVSKWLVEIIPIADFGIASEMELNKKEKHNLPLSHIEEIQRAKPICEEKTQELEELISVYLKSKGLAGASFDEIRDYLSNGSGKRRGVSKILIDSLWSVEIEPGRYVHRDNIMDMDFAGEKMLQALQRLFRQGDGYASSKQFYGAVRTELDLFMFDNDIDDIGKMYAIAKHLFAKECFRGNEFIFYNNFHMWEKEPDYPKSATGLLIHFAREQGGVVTRGICEAYLDRIGIGYPSIATVMQIGQSGFFWQCGDEKYVLAETIIIDDSWKNIFKSALDALIQDTRYVILRDIANHWFEMLPRLPGNVMWSPMLVQEALKNVPVGYRTIDAGFGQSFDVLHAAITTDSSGIKCFADVVWDYVYHKVGIPVLMESEQLRKELVNAGMLAGNEKLYTLHKSLEDYHFIWLDNNKIVRIVEG